MRMYLRALFMGLFILPACAPKQSTKAISTVGSQALINGDVVQEGDPIARSTVQLIVFDNELARTSPRTICSASIISESIILTAAHCMTNKVDDTGEIEVNVSSLWIYFSNIKPLKDDRIPDKLIRKAINGAVPSGWNYSVKSLNEKRENTDDIGIISFAGGLPENFAAAKLPDSTTALKAHQQIIAAGFGAKGSDAYGGYVKASQLLSAAFEITEPNFTEGEFSAHDPNKHQFTCFGDSGGPLYIRDSGGNLLVAGVVSHGTPIVKDWNLPSCGDNNYQIFTRVSYYLNWISSESEKLNAEL